MSAVFAALLLVLLLPLGPALAEPSARGESLAGPLDLPAAAFGPLALAVRADVNSTCVTTRFRVMDASSGRMLGQSPLLAPGEFAVIRLRPSTAVTIRTLGCTVPPHEAYPLRLQRRSPDHGARALRHLAAIRG